MSFSFAGGGLPLVVVVFLCQLRSQRRHHTNGSFAFAAATAADDAADEGPTGFAARGGICAGSGAVARPGRDRRWRARGCVSLSRPRHSLLLLVSIQVELPIDMVKPYLGPAFRVSIPSYPRPPVCCAVGSNEDEREIRLIL